MASASTGKHGSLGFSGAQGASAPSRAAGPSTHLLHFLSREQGRALWGEDGHPASLVVRSDQGTKF